MDERLLDRAFTRSNAPRWNLSRDAFARALERSIASRFATEVKTPAVVSEYVDSLNLEELALACACAEGQVSAWAYFIECHRPGLRAAARAIAGDDAGGELADSIYAELYGLEERDGRRRSLFDYFHGRSRLSTWLRSILAQRNVDLVRAAKRTRPLEEHDEAVADAGAAGVQADPERARFAGLAQQALASAIRQLEPPDRLRLSSYYLQRLTLAQIGRLMGEHEATVSRKLDRIRRGLRAEVERLLREDHRLGRSQVQACLDSALEDVGMDLDEVLGNGSARARGWQEKAGGSF
ncbi:MAG TPA: sigma-70 family RNA polymerase sigma factor [Vicinamibacterales bacterium]